MTRISTKIGDVFSVRLGDHKKYFQYISNDLTQLNSNVIRGFKKHYQISDNPDLFEIVNGEVGFYAHCLTKLGVKLGLWEKVGNILEVGSLTDFIFKDTNDYVRKAGEEPVKVSKKWYIWKINDKDFTDIGALDGKYKKAYVGFVINPNGIIELLKGNKYPSNYPD